MDLSGRLRSEFVTGLALVAPLLITILAFQLAIGWLSGIIDPVVEGTRLARLTGSVPYAAEVIALVLLVLVVALLGHLAQRRLGAYFFDMLDRGIARVPVFSVVYTGVRQVSDALMSQQSRFDSVVMVEYPRAGLYALGFVTADSPTAVSDGTGEPTQNVYLPNSPNPTNGHLAMVPEGEITELDMSVSQGIRLLVTTGIAENQEEMAALREEAGREVADPEGIFDGSLEEASQADREGSAGGSGGR